MHRIMRINKWFPPRLIGWISPIRWLQLIAGGILVVATAIAVVVALLTDGTWYPAFCNKTLWV